MHIVGHFYYALILFRKNYMKQKIVWGDKNCKLYNGKFFKL